MDQVSAGKSAQVTSLPVPLVLTNAETLNGSAVQSGCALMVKLRRPE